MTEPLSSDAFPAPNAGNGWHAAYLHALPDAVLALDAASGRILTANPAALRLFNYRFDALCGLHFSCLLPTHTSNASTRVERRFRLTGELAESETFCDIDGVEFPCDVIALPVRDGDTELVVLQVRDARAREAARQAHLDAERAAFEADQAESVIRVVDKYMGHVSHELKTPLAVILSSSSMLERYYLRLSETKRSEHFTRIQSQVRYLTELLDNLRFLSHLDAGQVEERREQFDVAELLQEVIRGYAGHPQEPLFDIQTGGEVTRLQMDGMLWRRIVAHLLSNAVKYGPFGGTVHVSVTSFGDGRLETRISDHGPGLPAEYRSVQFEVFQRGPNASETQGGGLGLAIAARCVALLGGSMTYETAPNSGTVFTVTTPVG